MVKDLSEYTSFVDFFTRQVKPREIDPNPAVLVSPADSKVLSIAEIKEDSTFLVKNINYSLGELITGKKGYRINGEILDSLKKS
jgi:phosphatidylserine decarboxylase